jgi:GTPase SAR1 family protein
MDETGRKGPVSLIVLGMAGSGKTSLVTRLTNSPKKPYVVNLDPACSNLPYFANIGERFNIDRCRNRDTVL